MDNECWLSIAFRNFNDLYSISNMGRVRSDKTRRGTIAGQIKANCPGPAGYCYVSLSRNGVDHRIGVHQLVAQAFIPNPEGKRCVNHKNGNKGDNRMDNLGWVTHQENTRHAMDELGWTAKKPRGSAHHKSKITESDVVVIRKEVSDGVMMKDLAVRFGIHASTVSSIVARRIWTHV